MKKVIRLTESDLVRIVERVIKEQEETTRFSPQSFSKLNLNNNLPIEVYENGQIKNWVIKPSLAYEKNTDGKMEPKKDTIRLKITNEGLGSNTYTMVDINCTTQKVSYRFKSVDENDLTKKQDNLSIKFSGRKYEKENIKNALLQAFGHPQQNKFSYTEEIQKVGDTYCNPKKEE